MNKDLFLFPPHCTDICCTTHPPTSTDVLGPYCLLSSAVVHVVVVPCRFPCLPGKPLFAYDGYCADTACQHPRRPRRRMQQATLLLTWSVICKILAGMPIRVRRISADACRPVHDDEKPQRAKGAAPFPLV